MDGLFNTLNKSLPGRSSKALEGQFLCCAVTLLVTLYSQLRCVRTLRKMFSCLRRSDRRESNGMGHVCWVEQTQGSALSQFLLSSKLYINAEKMESSFQLFNAT